MRDMLLKKILLQRLITLKLRDRRLNKTQNFEYGGFTLIELLVVIIIIGLLAAIALPSFLNQSNKARFAEAKSYVGTMSRLQQAYYLEKQTFTGDINKLGLGVNTASSSFTYSVAVGDVTGATTPQQLDRIITNVAEPKSVGLKAFIGVVAITALTTSAVKADTVFCIADLPGTSSIAPGAVSGDGLTAICPTNFSVNSQ